MVGAKRTTRSSSKTSKETEASENALAQEDTSDPEHVNVEPPKTAVQCEDKVEVSLEQATSVKDDETYSIKTGNAITVVNDDEDEIRTEPDEDNLADEEPSSSEDDESYNQEDMSEDDEGNSEELDEEDSIDKDEKIVEFQIGDESKDVMENKNKVEDKGNAEGENNIKNGYEGKTQEPITEKVEGILNDEVNKSIGKSKKKVQPASSKKVEFAYEDKPESSRKRKSKERVESMGMIFMCSSMTKDDCFRYRVLGLPASKKDEVEKIYPGMRLFLYDVDLKLLNGIYKAAGPGGYNIEPRAFKSQFPSQVRFKVLKDCLPVAEEKFKKVIKDNYFSKNKFDCKLTSVQVKKLCKLFLAASRGQHLIKSGRSHKAGNHTSVRGGRVRVPRAEAERLRSLRQELEYRDRSRKRRRRVVERVSPVRRRRVVERVSPMRRRMVIDPVSPFQEPLHLRMPAPQPSSVHSYAHAGTLEDGPYRKYPYIEICDSYGDGPLLNHGDPYRDQRDALIEQRDSYRAREQRNFYGDRRDLPIERHTPCRDGRDIRLERPSLGDGQGAYQVRNDLYRDRRDSYLLHHSPHTGVPLSDHYVTYGNSDRNDIYRDNRLVETRDSYGRKLLLTRRDLEPLVEPRRVDDISSRDSYVSHQAQQSYMEPTYSAEYPSRTGLEQVRRPMGPLVDHHSTRGQLSGYYSHRA